MATPLNTTQFMTSVMQKLRTADQVSRSNNLSTIAKAGNGALPVSNPVQESEIKAHYKNGKKNGNAYKEDYINGFGINDGNGLVTDPKAREVLQDILTPMGTVADIGNEIFYGVTKVGESLVDGLVGLAGWIGTLFGADDQWAKDFIAVDCSRYVADTVDFIEGGWITQLAFGETLAEQSAFNYIDSEEVQNNIRSVENIVGEIIPSLVLAYFTGGASIGVQIAAQGGLAFASSFGQSIEGAVNENPDVELGKAVGYGAIKGGISGVLAGVSMGAGSAIAAKTGTGIAGKIGDKIIDKGGSMVASMAAQAGFKMTTSAGRAAAMTAIDPLVRQITIDGEAIEKAYGSDEAVMNTLSAIGKNAATAAIVTLGMTAVQDTVAVKNAGGMKGYTQKYFDERAAREAGLTQQYKVIKEYTKKVEKLDKQFSDNKITLDQWKSEMAKLNMDYEFAYDDFQDKYFNEYLKTSDHTYKRIGEETKTNDKYASFRESAGLKTVEGLKDVSEISQQLAKNYGEKVNVIKNLGQVVSEGINAGYTKEQMKTFIEQGKNFNNWKDFRNSFKSVDTGKEVNLNLKVVDADKKFYNVPATISTNSEFIAPINTAQTKAVVLAIKNGDIKKLPDSIKLPKNLSTLNLEKKLHIGTKENIVLPTKVVEDVVKENPSIQPKDIVSTIKQLKNNVVGVSKGDDGLYIVTTKDFDANGKAVFTNFKYDENTGEIKGISLNVPKEKAVSYGELVPKDTPAHIVEGAADMLMSKKVSLTSSTNVVKHYTEDVKVLVKSILGNNPKYKIDLKGTEKVGRYLFEKINDPKVSSMATNELTNALTDIKIHDGAGNSVTLKDLFELEGRSFKDYTNKLYKEIKLTLENESKETKISKLEKLYDKHMETIKGLMEKNRESVKAGGAMRVFVNKRNANREITRSDLKWDDDHIKNNTMSLMTKPLNNIHSSGDVMSTRGFWENIEEFKANYRADNPLLNPENNPRIPFQQDFLNEMLRLEEMMPKMNADGTYPRVSAVAFKQMNRIYDMIKHYQKVARQDDLNLNPKGRAIVRAGTKDVKASSNNSIVKTLKSFDNGFGKLVLNRYTMLKHEFKQNPWVNEIIDKFTATFLQTQDEVINKLDEVRAFEKLNKINKLLSKQITISGENKISYQELAYWHDMFTAHQEEVADIARVNKIYLSNGHQILQDMSLDEFKKFVLENTPDNMKEYGRYIIEERLNGADGDEYDEIYTKNNGVDSNRRDLYIPTSRHGESQRSGEIRGVFEPTFGNEKTRVSNNNGYNSLEIKSLYMKYIKGLATQKNLMPLYKETIKILSTKMNDGHGGTTTPKAFLSDETNFPKGAYNRLVKFIEDCVGFTDASSKQPNLLDKAIDIAMNLRITATLSKPSVAAKQPMSVFTSNVRLTNLLKGAVLKVAQRPEMKAEHEWALKNLPGYATRMKSSAALKGELVGGTKLDKYIDFMSDKTMILTKLSDYMTINYLASAGLMAQIETDYGFKIGTPEFREALKEHWTDTLMKQIGTTPGHKSGLTSSNSIARLFFGNYQGAITAFASGVRDKLNTLAKCWNWDGDKIAQAVKDTKDVRDQYLKRLEESQKALDEQSSKLLKAQDDLFDARNGVNGKVPEDEIELLKAKVEEEEHAYKRAEKEYETNRDAYQEKAADYEEAKGNQKTWNKFKSYGGKKGLVPNLVVSTFVMALGLSLVDQIKKWAIGQEDIKNFNAEDFFTGVLLNSSINQVPVLNTVYGMLFNNYDISNPGVSFVQDVVEIGKSMISGKWEDVLRNSAWLVADTSGLPLKGAYQLIYGITKAFDPETAIKMGNVVYGISDSSNVRSLNTAVKNGDDKQGVAYLDVVFENKVSKASDEVIEEFYSLYKNGNVALPKANMESYTDENGEVISLTDAQKTTFRNTYSKANSMVDKLIKNTVYSQLNELQKGKAITNVYNLYYELAKSKVVEGYAPTSKFASVFIKTDGNIDGNTIAGALAYIGELEDTKKLTRKQQAIKYVNSLNCERGLKLLILKLCGYGLSEKESKNLEKYLKSKGMSKKDVKEFLGEKKNEKD